MYFAKKLYMVLLIAFFTMTCATGLFLPHIITSGTHYEVGLDIGKTFKGQIQEYYKLHPLLHSKFLPWLNTDEGKKVMSGYISQMQTHFPQYVEELKGISLGADVPLMQVYCLVFQVELSVFINASRKLPPQCSDVYVNSPTSNLIIMGHNEDTSPLVKDRGYLVTAHISDPADYPGSRITKKTENFTHFSYPGILPGNAFGFNSYGLVQTVNALYPDVVLSNHTGRYVLTRALLTAESMEEVQHIMLDEGVGCAFGISVNYGILPTKTNKLTSPEIWNVELAPDSTQPHTTVNLLQITSNGSGFGYHVNKYKRIHIREQPSKVNSSIHRTDRIKEIIQSKGVPTTNQKILDILGDEQDREFPIYRTPRPTDPGCTVATALFNLQEETLSVFKDNPAKSKSGPVATFKLL